MTKNYLRLTLKSKEVNCSKQIFFGLLFVIEK